MFTVLLPSLNVIGSQEIVPFSRQKLNRMENEVIGYWSKRESGAFFRDCQAMRGTVYQYSHRVERAVMFSPNANRVSLKRQPHGVTSQGRSSMSSPVQLAPLPRASCAICLLIRG